MKKEKKNRSINRIVETYEAIVINSEDVLLLGDHVAEATTSRVLEGNARGLGTQDSIDVVPVVELVVKPYWNVDDFRRITILNNDQMILLKERSPHLKEVEVSNRRYHNV